MRGPPVVGGHPDEESSQLARAEKALKNNPGAVVTLSLGGNDLLRTALGSDADRGRAIADYGRNLDHILETLREGQAWAFRLTANPTRSRPAGEGSRSQRYGHVTVAQQQEWLLSRAPRAGFEVPGDGVVVRRQPAGR